MNDISILTAVQAVIGSAYCFGSGHIGLVIAALAIGVIIWLIANGFVNVNSAMPSRLRKSRA